MHLLTSAKGREGKYKLRLEGGREEGGSSYLTHQVDSFQAIQCGGHIQAFAQCTMESQFCQFYVDVLCVQSLNVGHNKLALQL